MRQQGGLQQHFRGGNAPQWDRQRELDLAALVASAHGDRAVREGLRLDMSAAADPTLLRTVE